MRNKVLQPAREEPLRAGEDALGEGAEAARGLRGYYEVQAPGGRRREDEAFEIEPAIRVSVTRAIKEEG